MKIFISAAETSSDIHASHLIREMLQFDSSLQIEGVGGEYSRSAGLKTLIHSNALQSMGSIEVLRNIISIFQSRRKILNYLIENQYDAVIFLDYPGLHFSIVKKYCSIVSKQNRSLLFYYIPPKLWVWRKNRAKILKKYFHKIYSIFPFEKDFFKKEGLEVEYFGNPLIDELPIGISKLQARLDLGVDEDEVSFIWSVLPGSRPSEILQHLEISLEATLQSAKKLNKRKKGIVFLSFPIAEALQNGRASVLNKIESWKKNNSEFRNYFDIRITYGRSAECLLASHFAWVKSGTSTLEAAMMYCPQVIFYKPSWLTGFLFKKVLGYKGPVGLFNILCNKKIIAPELICEDVTVEQLTKVALEVIENKANQEIQLKFGRNLLVELGQSESPSRRVAISILKEMKAQEKRE